MVHKLDCSNSPTKMVSPASWRAIIAELWNWKSVWIPWVVSHTTLWQGSLLINRNVLILYFLISFSAFMPLFKPFLHLSSYLSPPTLSHSSLFSLLLPYPFPFLFFLLLPYLLFTAWTLWTFSFLILTCWALVNIVLVLHAISITETSPSCSTLLSMLF